MLKLNQLPTEQRNPNTADIDRLSTLEMVRRINDEDKKVAYAVEKQLEPIARAVDAVAGALSQGGRLFYCGCGTSGRLGILDAVECPPTYSTDPEMVQGIIAGGEQAVFQAVEGAEDDAEAGRADLAARNIGKKDVLVGIAASGRTPYVLGAMRLAAERGAVTVAVTCNAGSEMNAEADISIAVEPGPEVITDSTRMKSGTAQKMVLNMISTGAMIRLGKVYGNLMVDVKPSNEKLVRRAVSIVCDAAGVGEEEARAALEQCEYSAKTAIVMLLCGLNAQQAIRRLEQAGGRVAQALHLHREETSHGQEA